MPKTAKIDPKIVAKHVYIEGINDMNDDFVEALIDAALRLQIVAKMTNAEILALLRERCIRPSKHLQEARRILIESMGHAVQAVGEDGTAKSDKVAQLMHETTVSAAEQWGINPGDVPELA